MKLLLTGGSGQLGRALQASVPAGISLVAPGRADLDLADPASITRAVAEAAPDLVINAGAYTAVDAAEADPAAAFAINAAAVAQLARLVPRLVQPSTDFVFDGTASRPVLAGAAANPLGVYGASKRAGEVAALAAPQALVVRTAWVYAAEGRNFVNTMLGAMRSRPALTVVADQIGTPTHAASLARAIWALVGAGATGIHHYTDAGTASWYDFAVAIQDEALALGLLQQPARITPIAAASWPTPARRPSYGVLDKTATWAITGTAQHWRHELRACLKAMT